MTETNNSYGKLTQLDNGYRVYCYYFKSRSEWRVASGQPGIGETYGEWTPDADEAAKWYQAEIKLCQGA